ncbi:hypothetical protein [Microbacterium sp.]|uniref:hypothetical protein n=1 Tax=Microbacterium sp. TaxID=51671 RepID=UPI0039E41C8E
MGTTDEDGLITLPDIEATSSGTTATIAATTSDGSSVSATITIESVTSTIFFQPASGSETEYPALPDGVTVAALQQTNINSIRRTYVLGSDGVLYRSVSGGAWSTLASSVTDIAVPADGAGGIAYAVDDTDVYFQAVSGSADEYPALTSGVTVADLQQTYFNSNLRTYVLGSDGILYRSVEGAAWTQLASNVTDIAVPADGGGGVAYAVDDTDVYFQPVSGSATDYPALPDGVTVAVLQQTNVNSTVRTYVLGSDGVLYRSVSGGAWSTLASSVTDIAVPADGAGGIAYAVDDTDVYFQPVSGSATDYPALPDGVTVAVLQQTNINSTVRTYVLGSDGVLYRSIAGAAWVALASSVTHIAVVAASGGGISYATIPSC